MVKSDKDKKEKGQLMVEAMVAVSLMLVGLLGIFGVLSRALGLSRVAADQYVAVNLAGEGIEVAKNIIDSNIEQGNAWNLGFDPGETYVDRSSDELGDCSTDEELYFDSETGLYNCRGDGSLSKFRRTIEVVVPEDELGNPLHNKFLKVISRVEWTGRGGLDSEVSVEDHFYSWRDN